MRLVEVEELKIGHKLGRSIYGDYGNLLLGKGVTLTSRLLGKLKKHHIYYVYIEDYLSEGIDPRGTISEATMIKSVRTIRTIMEKMTDVKNKNSASGVIPINEYLAVEDIIKYLMEEISDNPDALYMITELIGTDMYTYQHSVNVAILSILTLKALNYDDKQVKNIAMGALLHDIGKAKIDNSLINKNDILTEDEFSEMKNHSVYGYDMIREDCVLPSHAKTIIKLHHEKLDGTGYPSGLKEKDIPEYVRVITICDMFDAMTTDRAYRKRMPIYAALETLLVESVYRVDATVVKIFLENICIYPLGTGVQLMDGRLGIITRYNKEFPDRPNIRIIKEGNGKTYLEEGCLYEIDLMKELTLFIDQTVSIED